jgi:hypothetical protein
MVFFLKISFVQLHVIHLQISSKTDNLDAASIYAGG